MTDLLSIQTALCLIFVLVVSNEQLTAFANDSCQLVSPSEYAYQRNSVFGSERSSANCRQYESGLDHRGSHTQNYNHCDGTQLRLTDSDLGSEQYISSDYYVWNAGAGGHQLLFIFPTRVDLTTITLHYYSDNTRGLPGLKFYAVPDNFSIWDALSASYSRVDIAAVPPGVEPAGRRNVSLDVNSNWNTKGVLLYINQRTFKLSVNEVEFYNCSRNREAETTISTTVSKSSTEMVNHVTERTANSMGEPTESSSTTIQTTTTFSSLSTSTVKEPITKTTNEPNATDLNNNSITSTENLTATGDTSTDTGVAIGTGIVIAIAIILLLTVIAAVVLVLMRKSAQKRKVDYDSSYSTLCRGSGQQMQSQSLHTSSDLYDQIQLSPSTGQAEFISRSETANTNNPPSHQTEYGIYPSADKDKPKSAKLKITASTTSTQDEDKSTSEQPTYAVVYKKRKQKTVKELDCQSQTIAEVSQNEGVSEQNVVEHGSHDQESQDSPDATTQFPSQTIDSPQELYTAVKKKPKDRPAEDEIAPPIPPYTTEELYTAVKKKPKASAAGDEQAPQIPPYTFEELYTAVQKKPKANATVDQEEAPPIPAHTVEELYTAVLKKPKASRAEDEEEAPPVPPYTMDEL